MARVKWLERGARKFAYEEEHYALQAAVAGQGLVLASSVMVSEHLKLGLLQPLHPEIRIPGAAYTALCAPGRQRHAPVRSLLTWLQSEIAKCSL